MPGSASSARFGWYPNRHTPGSAFGRGVRAQVARGEPTVGAWDGFGGSAGGPAGLGTRPPWAVRPSCVPSVSMNPCPLPVPSAAALNLVPGTPPRPVAHRVPRDASPFLPMAAADKDTRAPLPNGACLTPSPGPSLRTKTQVRPKTPPRSPL
ncbi:hypothetical protein GCM10010493_05190 [Streptomyces lavendulae subsp. grasserius]